MTVGTDLVVDSALLNSLRDKLPVFQQLTAGQAVLLAEHLNFSSLATGQILWKEEEDSHYLAFVLSGRIQMKKNTEFGSSAVVVGILTTGSVLGEIAFSRKGCRALSASALEPCELAVLTRPRLDTLMAEHPDLGAKVLESLLQATCGRLEQAYQRLAAIF